MNNIYDNFGRPDLPPTENRLEIDIAFGPLNYPDHLDRRDQYFQEGFALIRTVNQPEKVRKVITSYLRCAKGESLRAELENFLQELAKHRR